MLSFNKWIGAVAIGQALLCSTLGLVAGTDDPSKPLSVQHFSSPQTEGFIGATDKAPIDNPADNIFHVQIDEPLCGEEKVWLVYDLDGVQDHTAVSRSVNDQVAVGGYFVKERHGWATQREQLNAAWLKAGDNVIRFTLPEEAAHSYRIRNLRIEVDRSVVTDPTPQIVFNQSSKHYFFDKAYIKGFVAGARYENVTIVVDGKEARIFNGEFEAIVDFAVAQNSCSVEVEARHADGTTTCHSVAFSEPLTPDYQYSIDQFTYRTEKYFDANKEGRVSLHGARLDQAVNALKENATLSITSLRAVDIPALDGGMVNVTKNHAGFRFLPHGTVFGKEVNVTLPFDPAAIPDGYTEKDIRTYYFDEQSHHWVAMTLDTVLMEKGEVVSKTLHFTDMINAIIKVPESPEVSAYNSTSMKGIKAANPTAGISLINPPQANNTGNASIGYPLNIPAGRAGMQPQLAISYNSGGGNGWMGLGWNLSLPMISIDTRWGVPRYDPEKETETYTMNGEQLTPVAHRGELRPRTSGGEEGVPFYPRVEGAFNKIRRHGATTADYWWEVTDKNGTRYFYGGNGTSQDDDAILRTDEANDGGHVAQWFLREVRDLNGNTVRYHYARVEDAGIKDGTVMGHQMYIEKITYTGVNGGDGPYQIFFSRESGRPDNIISANLGFKQVTSDRLKKIDVKFGSDNIRSYELRYKTGQFGKSLLEAVDELDLEGALFQTHTFEYYDEVGQNEGFKPLAEGPTDWNAGQDNVNGNFANPFELFNDEASAISGTRSKDSQTGLSVTVGSAAGSLWSKCNTVGGKFGGGRSESEGMLTMTDINGDGLSDKVYLEDGVMKYRANMFSMGNETTFGKEVIVKGMNAFQSERSKNSYKGLEAIGCAGGINANIGKTWSKGTSVTSMYFTDANGDQLPDIVNSGVVWFNHLDPETGEVTYSTDSRGTGNPIQTGGVLAGIDRQENQDALEQARRENPLHDMVRMWRAPYAGKIKIDAPVQLLRSGDPEREEHPADGIRITVEHEGRELKAMTIDANDYGEHAITGLENIIVQRGQRIFFRLQSIENGSYDSVRWSPVIEYHDEDLELTDANGKPLYRFSSAEDFLLSADQEVTAPINGRIMVDGNFFKPQTSDDVRFEILKNPGVDQDTIWSKLYAWNVEVDSTLAITVEASKDDIFVFRVSSETNVDVSSITWTPQVYYSASYDPAYERVVNDEGDPLINFHPIPRFSMYPIPYRITEPSVLELEVDSVKVQPVIELSDLEFIQSQLDGNITFSVKKLDTLLWKTVITVVDGALPENLPTGKFAAKKDDTLFFEYDVDEEFLAAHITKAEANLGSDAQFADAGIFTIPDEDPLLGPLYRGWGHFAYNANDERDSRPIDLSLLKLSDKAKNAENLKVEDEIKNPDDVEGANGYDPATEILIVLAPVATTEQWMGYDELTVLSGTIMSSSRLGEDDLTSVAGSSGPGGGGIVPAINKVTVTKGSSFGIGGGFKGIGAGANEGTNETSIVSDFMDLNGDRFPDVVTKDFIQFTDAQGRLGEPVRNEIGIHHKTMASSSGASLSGSMVESKVSTNSSNLRKAVSSVGNALAGNGLSGDYGEGKSEVPFTYIDINGDGLPDRVRRRNDAGVDPEEQAASQDLLVSLNHGYSFGPEEVWPIIQNHIQAGKSTSYGGGVGVSVASGSINAGVGASRSENETTASLEDINGDGLVDELLLGEDVVQVKLNTGSGFASAMDWPGARHINQNRSTSESVNVAFTGCIPLYIIGIRICINPSTSKGRGVSRELTKFADVNGDGYPDYIHSTINNKLEVKLSTIGRTNMLKQVNRPLGASFSMTYSRIGNTYAMPQSNWVLDSVMVFDGFADDGVDSMLTTFVYEDGKYDRREREFYGFSKVITNTINTEDNANTVYTTVTQAFDNDNYYKKGLLLSEVMTDGEGNKYVEKINQYELKDISSGAALTDDQIESDAGNAFPALVETVQMFYEGQSDPGKQTSTAYKYDVNGNITDYIDHGDDTPDDDLHATITYHNYPDKYLIGSPEHITVKHRGVTLRERKSVIDPATGNVTQIRQFLSEDEVAVYDMEYDQYGNLEKITRPENEKGERLSIVYKYDNVVNTYPTNVSNSYGYSSEAQYDFKFGQVLMSKDLNGNEITYELDAKGRVQFITGPYEKGTGNKTIEFVYHPEAEIPWALTRHYDPSDPQNKLETEIFVDGLGRVLQTKKDVAIYQGEGKADTGMMVVSGRVEFDAFGRTVSALYPVTEPKDDTPGEFNDEKDQEAGPTVTEYDVLNRTLKVTLPDKSVTATAYGFGSDRDGNNQFSTKTTDANGKQTEQFTDVRGRVTAVKNYASKQGVWTSFKYNAINEQVEATNDLGHTTISMYDNLGRRTTRIHPDAGQTNYFYDLAGNLIELQTANLIEEGLSIDYVYDHERLVEIHYPQNPENNVKYTYGEPGASDNRAGRIVIQEDGSGAQEFFYGPLGEVVKNIRTVVIPQHDEQTYTTQWQYDTWNRLTSMTYPDGEKVTYNYNSGGLLRSMTGKKKGTTFNYVSQLGYDKFEQRVYLEYGNGTKTHYEYEPDRRRLHNMTAQTKTKRLFMDNVYGYDKVNNIKTLVNKAPIPSSNLMGGSSTYSYDYDDLYRLTTAEGSYKGSNEEHSYTLSMDYNSVGGITQKTQVHKKGDQEQKKTTYDLAYAYGETQPNAPIHIGDQSYTYDANGNQTGWTSDISGQQRKIMWDEENRIRSIYDNGSQHHYIYDAAGERVLKGKSTGQRIFVNGEWKAGSGQMGNYTVYVNPYLVLKSGGYTKHYYIEGQRIVSKLGGGWDNKNAVKAGGNKVDYVGKTQKVFDGIVKNLKFLGADGQILTAGKSGKVPPGQISGSGNVAEPFRYFYHPDHLGSTSYVTDASGEVYQHLEYFAFGETFVEEHSNTNKTPYLFNGKELDEETGLYYYGARYYDARTSNWLSVDPLAEKFPDMTPYNYTFNNPIKYNDPDGRCPICPGAFIDLAVRAKLWFDKLSGATQRLATGKSGQMASDAPAPNDVRRMQRVLGTMNDAGTVAQSVVDVGEGAAQIISSIPGVETGGDIAGVFYYGLLKGDGESAAMHAVAIFLPAVSGSQIKAIGKFASGSKQVSHFEKHAAEFAGKFKNADEYLKGAQDFFRDASKDVLQFTRKNGDVVQYNAKTNEFGAIDKDGNIRTFFKPERGKDYFMDQVKKEAGNGN